MIEVYKFGGASVKEPNAVKNVAKIIKDHGEGRIIVVLSAMGKTTNDLEEVVRCYFYEKEKQNEALQKVRDFHKNMMDELFPQVHPVRDAVNNLFVEIEWVLEDEPNGTYNFIYDQIVSQGEMMSTVITAAWLKDQGLPVKWIDARDLIRTDNNYREARVDWETSQELMDRVWKGTEENEIILTQGFIGGTSENYTTTLGREGSDYTASILAWLTNASRVTIWKDVPGVLNADPKYFTNCVLLQDLSYQDALELAYYGATVLHPKTIKPLQNKGIPLFVRSFIEPGAQCTRIGNEEARLQIPGFIVKREQVLISISPRDFSFIAEDNLRDIFEEFASRGIHIHVMQNSALSFSACTGYLEKEVKDLIENLKSRFIVRYNHPVDLITIRNADAQTVERVSKGREILLDLRSRNTVQLVVRKNATQD